MYVLQFVVKLSLYILTSSESVQYLCEHYDDPGIGYIL